MTTVRHCAAHGRGGATRSNVIITALAAAAALWVAFTAPHVSPVAAPPAGSAAVSVAAPQTAKPSTSPVPSVSTAVAMVPVPADGESAPGQR